MIKVAAALNSFASEPEAPAPPSEEIFVLSAGQLQDLISEAIRQAMAPLEARIQDLEDEVRGRGAGGGVEALQDLRSRLEDLEESTARERAFDRQRISRLEKTHKDSPKAQDYIDKLYKIMRHDRLPSLSFANAAKFLGISKGRVKQLKPQILNDGRFDIFHAPGQKKKLIITLRRHGVKNG
jgi:hypothetical protein